MLRIRKFVVFGDSLSDRGLMAQSALAPLSGLQGKSPEGRFTNGYVWFEYFLRDLLGDLKVFGDARTIGLPAVPDLAQTFCIGGMTAYNYTRISLEDEVTQLKDEAKAVGLIKAGIEAITDPIEAQVLWSLEAMRQSFFKNTLQVSEQDKVETLVIEWSGANDFVTINQCPTENAIKLAVEARLSHVREMVKAGYRHFVLFNLPALDLTPRFQEADETLREETQKGVEFFNAELKKGIESLQTEYEENTCTFHLFDANSLFKNAYENPTVYGFSESKKNAIYTESEMFLKEGTGAPDEGYMFWDRVHPMTEVHQLLGKHFRAIFDEHYLFTISPENQIDAFRQRHTQLVLEEKRKSQWCCYGFFVSPELNCEKENLTMEEIQAFARTRPRSIAAKVLNEFGLTEQSCAQLSASVLPEEAHESERLMDEEHDDGSLQNDMVVEVGDVNLEIRRATWHTF